MFQNCPPYIQPEINMITVANQTIQTVVQTVVDATNPGKDVLYTPVILRSSPAPSAAPAAAKDCS